ncbi:MAG: DUF2188 domain-containing protein [Vicinamibacterales bacterium]
MSRLASLGIELLRICAENADAVVPEGSNHHGQETRRACLTGGNRSGWQVTQNSQVQSNHRTQQAAIDAGRREAKRGGVDLVTHNRKDVIRSNDSFGNDPNPPHDIEH